LKPPFHLVRETLRKFWQLQGFLQFQEHLQGKKHLRLSSKRGGN
jgi:hypothetical protein